MTQRLRFYKKNVETAGKVKKKKKIRNVNKARKVKVNNNLTNKNQKSHQNMNLL